MPDGGDIRPFEGAYKPHPLAELFPMMSDAALAELTADIEANGVREPVVMLDGMVLDGRNRYLAAREIGAFVPTVEFAGDDPLAFVISLNLRRRHLSESQRAAVAAKIANLKPGDNQFTARAPANLPLLPDVPAAPAAVSQSQAAEMLNVSERSVRAATRVLDHGTPALIASVEAGEVSVSAAAEVAKLPEELQAEIVDEGPAAVREAAKEIRETGHVNRTSFTGNNQWFTPAAYLDKARQVLGDIDLDPATHEVAQERVGASAFFTEEDDGLAREWFGRVWLNPPYAQPAIGHFVDKLIEEVEAERVDAAVMLTHNYTDTVWFQKAAQAASAICFTRGRVRFESPTGELAAPTQGQAFFYFGADLPAFLAAFHDVGFVVEVRK